MALPPVEARLDSVNRVRSHQRAWIADTRKRVEEGAPFAICNGDEAEEIFLSFGIPVLAINYWNFLIAAKGQVAHFTKVLNERGYPGQHFFALGLASSLEPELAPWGGLPNPTIICGSGRSETELRVTELWARAAGAHCFPMDFSFPADRISARPVDWWNYTRARWDALVDPHRLEFRAEQERALISFVEQISGLRFDEAQLYRAMSLVNVQMEYWAEAGKLIASRPCPVHIRDQMSMYQAMWHRGTATGVDMLRAYRDEVADRVRQGIGGYHNERIRLYFSGDVPAWSQFAEEEFGAVTVANFYSAVPDCYARTIHGSDPVRTLAGRHLFLFDFNPEWIAHVACSFDCDAVIVTEPFMDRYPPEASRERNVVEAAGLRYLALPSDADDPENRDRLRAFFEKEFVAL